MGRLFKEYINNDGGKHYVCKECSTDLVLATDMISDEFRSGHHKAMLFSNVINVDVGEVHDRSMTSGVHTIQNIFCVDCKTELGWKYLTAKDDSNKYKEGKFILIDPLIAKRERSSSTPSPTTPSSSQPSSQVEGQDRSGGLRAFLERTRSNSSSGGSSLLGSRAVSVSSGGGSASGDYGMSDSDEENESMSSGGTRRATGVASESERGGIRPFIRRSSHLMEDSDASIITQLRLMRRLIAETSARTRATSSNLEARARHIVADALSRSMTGSALAANTLTASAPSAVTSTPSTSVTSTSTTTSDAMNTTSAATSSTTTTTASTAATASSTSSASASTARTASPTRLTFVFFDSAHATR